MARKTKAYAWKDPRGLARVAEIVLWTNVLVFGASSLLALAFGEASNYVDEIQTAPQFARLILDLATPLVYCASIVLVFWLVRASKNAHAFKTKLKISPAGSIFWYFVPFMSLFKPFEAMSEIWQASSIRYTRRDDHFLRIWWTLFLINAALSGLYALSMAYGPEVLVGLASDLAAVALAAVAIVLVRRLTMLQVARNELRVFEEPTEQHPRNVLEAVTG